MASDEIHLRDEDRLPWLETVEPDEPRGPGVVRAGLFVLLGLAIMGMVVFAWRKVGAPATMRDPSGALIQAPAGDYKVKPDDPGGLHVTGEGEQAIATSTGAKAGGSAIDPHQMPEKPVDGHYGEAAKPVAAGGATALAAVPAGGGRLVAPAPIAAPHGAVPGAASGGSSVQLGAFPTEGSAKAAWAAMAKRFGYVATLAETIEPADVNGRHVFRLRANAGSATAAADVCGRLKVAGEGCFVVAG